MKYYTDGHILLGRNLYREEKCVYTEILYTVKTFLYWLMYEWNKVWIYFGYQPYPAYTLYNIRIEYRKTSKAATFLTSTTLTKSQLPTEAFLEIPLEFE